MGCHFLLQGIVLTQELNLGLLHCRQILYRLSYEESPLEWVVTPFFRPSFLYDYKWPILLLLFVVQSLSCVWLFATPWTAARQASMSFTVSWNSLKLTSMSRWCHPTISFSAACFSLCLQSFPASGSFPMSWLFVSDGQNTGASALASVLPMNIQGWFPLGWTGWVSLQPKGLKSLLQHHNLQASVLQHSAFFMVQLSHPYMTIHSFDCMDLCKVISLLFNTQSTFVVAFLPKSKCILISGLLSLSTVILDPKKIVCHHFHCFPTYLPWSDGTWCHVPLVFWVLSFKPAYSLTSFTLIKKFFSFSSLKMFFSSICVSEVVNVSLLIPACDSLRLAFQMIYSAYKLNKQGDNIQPCHTPFPILSQSFHLRS